MQKEVTQKPTSLKSSFKYNFKKTLNGGATHGWIMLIPEDIDYCAGQFYVILTLAIVIGKEETPVEKNAFVRLSYRLAYRVFS